MCAASGAHATPPRQQQPQAALTQKHAPLATGNAVLRLAGLLDAPCRTSTRARLTAATRACRTPTKRTSRCAARRGAAAARAHALARAGLHRRPVGGSGAAVLQGRDRSAAAAQARCAALCAPLQELTAPAPLQPGPRDGGVRGGVQAEAARPRAAVQGQAAGAPPPAAVSQPYRVRTLCTAAVALPPRAWPALVHMRSRSCASRRALRASRSLTPPRSRPSRRTECCPSPRRRGS